MSRLVESDLIATLSNQVTSLSSTVASLSATVTRQNDLIQKLLAQNTAKPSVLASKAGASTVTTPKPTIKRVPKVKTAQSTPNPPSNPIPPSSIASGSGTTPQAGSIRSWDSPGPPPPAYSSPLNVGIVGTKPKRVKSRLSAPNPIPITPSSQTQEKTSHPQSALPIPPNPIVPRSLHEAMSYTPSYPTSSSGIPPHMTLNSFASPVSSQPKAQTSYPTPQTISRPSAQASHTSQPPPPTYHATPNPEPWAPQSAAQTMQAAPEAFYLNNQKTLPPPPSSDTTSQSSHAPPQALQPSSQIPQAEARAAHLTHLPSYTTPMTSQPPPQTSYPTLQTSYPSPQISQASTQISQFPLEKPSPPTSIYKSDSGSDYAPATSASPTSSIVPAPPSTIPATSVEASTAPPPVPTLASALAAMPPPDDETSPLTTTPLSLAVKDPKLKVKKAKPVIPKPPHASVPTINAAIPDPTGRPVFPMFGKRWLPCILTAWWFADPANGVPIPLRDWDIETRLKSRDKWKKAEWIARGWHILKGHHLMEHPEDQLEVIDLSQLDADVEAWEKRWGEKQNTALAVIRQAIRDDPANYAWAPVKFGEAKKRKLEEEAAAAEAGIVEEDNREYRFIEYDPVKRIKGMWDEDLSAVGFDQLL